VGGGWWQQYLYNNVIVPLMACANSSVSKIKNNFFNASHQNPNSWCGYKPFSFVPYVILWKNMVKNNNKQTKIPVDLKPQI